MKILIYGAGSIGNHYANGLVERNHQIYITDNDPKALKRMKDSIYPNRYGSWNNKINLLEYNSLKQKSFFDVVIIGTPPNSHMDLCLKSIENHKPKIIHIEKPICTPDLSKLKKTHMFAKKNKVILLNGYNHNLTKNTLFAKKLLENKNFGRPLIMNTYINEHWGGIFEAHPWIKKLSDSYLSNFNFGGGAMNEHSHGINLWLNFSEFLKMGKIENVNCRLVFEQKKNIFYDKIMYMNVISEKGLSGNIIQDVVSKPHRKLHEIFFENGKISIINNVNSNYDRVEYSYKNKSRIVDFKKTRKDDFIGSIKNIEKTFKQKKVYQKEMSFKSGMDTMYVIKSGYISHIKNKQVKIKYFND